VSVQEPVYHFSSRCGGQNLFNMTPAQEPVKPGVHTGWPEAFPPINLNFTNRFWRFAENPTIFIGKSFPSWQQLVLFLSFLQRPSVVVAAVVCRKAYPTPYPSMGFMPFPEQ
jgi:hypothetical protein